MKIFYDLRGGHWNFKDEVKMAFYRELYEFVEKNYPEGVASLAFKDMVIAEPYIIGNTFGKYYLKEIVGGALKDQPDTHFIGYCVKHHKFLELIPHLIRFFALWRDIEGCSETHATDFFASSWASLVDTAKFFKYTTVEELKVSPEAPSVQDIRILTSIQNCPEQYRAPEAVALGQMVRIPSPRKVGFTFLGWYLNPKCLGEKVEVVVGGRDDLTLYAKWGTHTFFHANDGYLTFEELYTDFLSDFSTLLAKPLTKAKERMGEHGWVSDFCKVEAGRLNQFFGIQKFQQKWQWLIDYVASLYQETPELQKDFIYHSNAFGNEEHVKWELNSLFVSRYHLIYPKTKDYSGAGIKECLANNTNSFLIRVDYVVGEAVVFPSVSKQDAILVGWATAPDQSGEWIKEIHDDRFSAKTIYAHWKR